MRMVPPGEPRRRNSGRPNPALTMRARYHRWSGCLAATVRNSVPHLPRGLGHALVMNDELIDVADKPLRGSQ